MHVFVATGLTQLDAQPEHEEQDIIRGCFTWPEFHRMVEDGEIADSHTLAALSLLRLKRPELVGIVQQAWLSAYPGTYPDPS